MKPANAIVTGAGAAGLTVALLLLRRGWRVDLHIRAASAGPTLVLRDATIDLVRQVWELEAAPLPTAHRLTERVVGTPDRTTLVDAAQAMPAAVLHSWLLEHLMQRFPGRLSIRELAQSHEEVPTAGHWWIDARGRKPRATSRDPSSRSIDRLACGERAIVGADARLAPEAGSHRWSFEAGSHGWLFVAPAGNQRAAIQLMTPMQPPAGSAPLEQAIAASQVARESVAALDPGRWSWDASPSFADPWPRSRTVRVGDATTALDPIGGDGTAHAIRTALLAAASLGAIEDGGDAAAIRDHYRQRLRLAFLAHLDACITTYAALPPPAMWSREVALMTHARARLQRGAPTLERLRFRLEGTNLARRESAGHRHRC